MIKYETNGYDPGPAGASSVKVDYSVLETSQKPKDPVHLRDVPTGAAFYARLNYLCNGKVTYWEGTFLKTGGAVVCLDRPGHWHQPNGTETTIEKYQRVDLQIKVVPHVS